ncbi:conserved protein of unknown function [Candidatus Hydrogenisulfobacillus filiaventi]|uniref:Thioredoxin domain-containing protein n=1 Tax=Candidatus Hydrogenisulfobacillus filiaventi TaxID=2707344 RepID=A0A6F8ZJQ9_9FIRM|nr:conserved protein of unknown function [Candidatus Hydrogenisulfobacillus filiaventi]
MRWGIVAGVAAGVLAAAVTAYSLARRHLPPPAVEPAPAPAAPAVIAVGQPFPWSRLPVHNLNNQPAALTRGRRLTVVEAMASWCRYCGWEDRYALPRIARLPGVAVDLVDISPHGGIADPGPEYPPFSGQDGSGPPEDVAAMAATMRAYRARYALPPAIHAYVALPVTQQQWVLSELPTLVLIGPHGRVRKVIQGALVTPRLEQAVTGVMPPS